LFLYLFVIFLIDRPILIIAQLHHIIKVLGSSLTIVNHEKKSSNPDTSAINTTHNYCSIRNTNGFLKIKKLNQIKKKVE
jgi:hypothetical protein